MTMKSYLTFSLHGALLAIGAKYVLEILRLPEITVIEEIPSGIIGIVNFRGKIMPVMDLDISLGHAHQRYLLTDRLVILEKEGLRMGIIVSETYDVIGISTEDIETASFYGHESHVRHFVAGEAKVGEDIISVLDHNKLLDLGVDLPETEKEAALPASHYFCPEASPEERAMFHSRAVDLMQVPIREDLAGLLPVAIVGLNKEYFGVDIGMVREFSDIINLTPIPCTPEHIIGNMNLRGNILTVIDIRKVLNMPFSGLSPLNKIIVTSIGEDLAGVVVDDVFDVICLDPFDITPVPLTARNTAEKYIKGMASYAGKPATLLNLSKILAEGELVVNEDV